MNELKYEFEWVCLVIISDNILLYSDGTIIFHYNSTCMDFWRTSDVQKSSLEFKFLKTIKNFMYENLSCKQIKSIVLDSNLKNDFFKWKKYMQLKNWK